MKRFIAAVAFIFPFFNVATFAQLSAVQQKAIIVKRMIELNHLSPRPVNDSFSESMFKTIINASDSRRLLFTETEYKLLLAYQHKQDEELKGGEWAFLNSFSQLYKKAIVRADSIIHMVTAKPFDFTIKETVSRADRNSFIFSTDVSALTARWSRYLKFTTLDILYDIVAADSTGKTSLKNVITASEVIVRERLKASELKNLKRISNHHSGIDQYIAGLYLNALSSSFDPHTNYFSPEGKQEFQESLSTEALSFGLDFIENDNGQVIIERLTPGGPAWKSGDLNKGDVLLSLLWEGKEAVDITGASLEEVYEELEKPATGKLLLKFQKADGTIKMVMLRKEKMENEDNIVKGFVLQGEKKIGYILLPGFYTEWENESGSSCANDVAKEIVKLKKENIDGLILDVRFNGGGSLGEAMEMIGIFIDEGPLTGIKTKEPKITYLKDPNRGTIYAGPMVLMVNGQSASASEILAASLQDYNRAVIAGSSTFGKATMQQSFPLDTFAKKLPTNSAGKDMVKITSGKLYRLNGATAQLNGVTPDVILPDAFDGIEYREKFSPNALVAEQIAKNSYYKPLPLLPVSELAAKSNLRLKNDNNFRDIQKIIDLVVARRGKAEVVSLKWDEFEKWAKEKDKEQDILTGNGEPAVKQFAVLNHSLDKEFINKSGYAQEINQEWLTNISSDIYIQEAFFILCDLIKLR